tara:strand:+ start:105 stop:452 length:348 start_codon:yes stop_codon:yes gene_type:complete
MGISPLPASNGGGHVLWVIGRTHARPDVTQQVVRLRLGGDAQVVGHLDHRDGYCRRNVADFAQRRIYLFHLLFIGAHLGAQEQLHNEQDRMPSQLFSGISRNKAMTCVRISKKVE